MIEDEDENENEDDLKDHRGCKMMFTDAANRVRVFLW